ncbi:MAG TPA: hypothetical protein VFX12_15205 [Vicinamibacterales bacterium]|nr:hypothetical protein [Vicinamibacterales bacterium]
MNRAIGMLVVAAAAVPLCVLPLHLSGAPRAAEPAGTRDAGFGSLPLRAEPPTVQVSQTVIPARLVHPIAASRRATRLALPDTAVVRDAAVLPAAGVPTLAQPAERTPEPHPVLSRWLFGSGRYRPSPFPRPAAAVHR